MAAIDRRKFLSHAALGVAATSLASGAGCQRAPRVASDGSRERPRSGEASKSVAGAASMRALFPLTDDYIHMSCLYLSSHPTPVRAAIERHRAGLDANPVLYMHEHRRRLESEVMAAAGRYMGVPGEQLALTDSTTMGLGLMYGGFSLAASDHVLSTVHGHYSTVESLRLATVRARADLQQIALYDDSSKADGGAMVRALTAAVRPETRLVAVTWVHSMSGVKLPIRDIANALGELNRQRERPVLLFVDGVHGFGIEDVAIADLGCDAFMAGTHKWIFGPRGTGIIWANQRGWDAVEATIPAFSRPNYRAWLEGRAPVDSPKPSQMSPGGFQCFEHRWAVKEAFELHLELGKPRVQEYIHGLTSQLKRGLAGMSHVRLHTPMSRALSSGIVCFEVDGKTPKQVVEALLERKIVASTTPYRNTYARLTPGIMNNPEEIDQVLAEVRALA